MDLVVRPDGIARWRGRAYPCSLGRGGIARHKREGDGVTPAGRFALRRVLWRPDRLARPACALPVAPIAPEDGWCDAPGDACYNRPVRLPYPASAEPLWREDGCYDLLAVVGYNDAPVVSGLGSAIFLHLVHDDGRPTAGCVALARADLAEVLAEWRPADRLRVSVD